MYSNVFADHDFFFRVNMREGAQLLIILFVVLDSAYSRLYDPDQPCGADVKKLCPPGLKNEFSAVGCLQREIDSDSSVGIISF